MLVTLAPLFLIYVVKEPPVTILEEGESIVRSLYATIIRNIYDNNPSFPRPLCFSNQSSAWWCGNADQSKLKKDNRDGIFVDLLNRDGIFVDLPSPSPSPSPNWETRLYDNDLF